MTIEYVGLYSATLQVTTADFSHFVMDIEGEVEIFLEMACFFRNDMKDVLLDCSYWGQGLRLEYHVNILILIQHYL